MIFMMWTHFQHHCTFVQGIHQLPAFQNKGPVMLTFDGYFVASLVKYLEQVAAELRHVTVHRMSPQYQEWS